MEGKHKLGKNKRTCNLCIQSCKSNVGKNLFQNASVDRNEVRIEEEKIVRSSEMEKEKCKHHLSWNNSQFPNLSQFVNALNSWIYNAA